VELRGDYGEVPFDTRAQHFSARAIAEARRHAFNGAGHTPYVMRRARRSREATRDVQIDTAGK
jgi:hypothetical protein